jgi:hypothetical protein
VVHEEAQVAPVRAGAAQQVGEALDRHVREREAAVELDAEVAAQRDSILLLEPLLWRRERGAERVVDQVEAQSRSRPRVAECAEAPERREAAVEDAAPALAIDGLRSVAGEAARRSPPGARRGTPAARPSPARRESALQCSGRGAGPRAGTPRRRSLRQVLGVVLVAGHPVRRVTVLVDGRDVSWGPCSARAPPAPTERRS